MWVLVQRGSVQLTNKELQRVYFPIAASIDIFPMRGLDARSRFAESGEQKKQSSADTSHARGANRASRFTVLPRLTR
jgi:hypothetical protein